MQSVPEASEGAGVRHFNEFVNEIDQQPDKLLLDQWGSIVVPLSKKQSIYSDVVPVYISDFQCTVVQLAPQ